MECNFIAFRAVLNVIAFGCLFYFSNQQNHTNTASDCYFKAAAESASSAYHRGYVVQTNVPTVPSSAASVDPPRGPVMDAEAARRRGGGHRFSPVMTRQSQRHKQLVEYNSPDGSSALSSPSTIGQLQTPVISDVSNDSSMSSEIRQLLPDAQVSAQNHLDVSLENNVSGQLVHCSSETNLVSAAGSEPHASQSHHVQRTADAGRQVIGGKTVPVFAENAQQLRRRSRSAENLSRRHRQKADGVAWSAVDVDIRANTESTVTDRAQQLDVQQQVNQSCTGQKTVDSLPSALTTTRLRPFRQQMNNGVVVSLRQMSNMCC